ncbi:MAG: hypothetical protein PHP65_04195 [Bacilli bacterium]|nr:hypothetical protein [Bacilli bacterium]
MSSILNINRFIIPNDVIVTLTKIYHWIGQNQNFLEVVKSDMNRIVEQTVERDSYFLSRILELEISDARTRLIITKNSTARTKEETTLYNIKEMLMLIQLKFSSLHYQSNDILNLVNAIYKHYSDIKFDYSSQDKKTLLQSQAFRSKRVILDDVITQMDVLLEKETFEKTTLYLHFFVDLYNIAPFTAHNDTAALFLLYLLILKADLHCFRFISFFELIYNSYDEFKTELNNASFNWKEGFSQTLGFVRFMNRIMIQGYEKTHHIIKEYRFDANINKANNIENTITTLPDIFTKEDIRLIHPYVSESTINRALMKLRDQGFIKPTGKGRSAKWMRIYKGFNRE